MHDALRMRGGGSRKSRSVIVNTPRKRVSLSIGTRDSPDSGDEGRGSYEVSGGTGGIGGARRDGNAMGIRLHNDFSSVTRATKGRRPRRDGQALSFLTSQLLPSFLLVAPIACRTAATLSSRPPWDGRHRRKERRNAGDVVQLCSYRSAQTTAVYNR